MRKSSKKLIAIAMAEIMSCICFTACNNSDTASNDVSGTTVITTTVNSEETETILNEATETTAEAITEESTESIIETEQAEIHETVQSGAIADNTFISEILDVYKNKEQWLALEIKYADLNTDGIDELFVTNYEYTATSFCGWLSIYDITSSAEPIAKVCLKNIIEDGIYKDADNQIHYIVRGDWWGQSDSYFMACFDISNSGLKVPLCGIANWWYDPGFECNYAVYKDVGYDAENGYNYGEYGFIKEKENFVGYFEGTDIKGTSETSADSVEFAQLVSENVYADMERIGEVTIDVATQKIDGSFDTDIAAVIAQHYNIENQ